MKKILYISHVAWGWIKQRPQFLAEELCDYYIVKAFYAKSNKFKKANLDKDDENLSVQGFRFLPFERFTFLPIKWSDFINMAFFKTLRLNIADYDVVWITHPRHYCLLKGKLNKRQILVYDCMDDMLEFPYVKKYPNLKQYIIDAERQLLNDSNIVICSAIALKKKLEERYGIERDYRIINNAITDDITSYKVEKVEMPENSMVYIGTISQWFDFESVIYALNKHPELHVLLYGPIRMQNPPQHPRLHFKGLVEHKEILSIMDSAKALVMPFVVNDLILSVNPVKLYEYIYTGKPVCAVRYGETEKFEEYIRLYSTKEEFEAFVSDILSNNILMDVISMKKFALENTWKSRAKQITNILEHEQGKI